VKPLRFLTEIDGGKYVFDLVKQGFQCQERGVNIHRDSTNANERV